MSERTANNAGSQAAAPASLLPPGVPEQLARHSDLLVSAGGVLVLAMLVLPLPHWALDMLLVVNLGACLAVLLLTTYTTRVLQFAVFPSLLLTMTLFRLALNVSATRLILLHANAGMVIAAFGQFVVGGNYVVGMVVFIILVVIQFVVITNGAGRVAEVAARFTLDAMPGKQMAIDADLNAGLINEEEARRRREAIAREADFYGAMDGASKFVRGDAIAAVVMIIVNILGGFIIGIVQRGMDLQTALRTYTLLTVGEGLVTQIPALILSTATGLIITRSSSGAPLGRDVVSQVLTSPRAVGLAALALVCFVLAPGLPKLPFLLVGAGFGLLATALGRSKRAPKTPARPAASRPAAPAAEQLVELISTDPLELEIGLELIPLADPSQGGDLLDRITVLRRRIAEEMGLIVPPLRVRDNLSLRALQYVIKLSGARIAHGEVRPGQVLVMDPSGAKPGISGTDTVDPAFGVAARWVPEARRTEAEMLGLTVVEPATVIITHLGETLKSHAAEILSLQDVRTMLDHLRQREPALVEEVTPKLLSLSDLHQVLANLLRERVPITDLPRILTALAGRAGTIKDPDELTEIARQALARSITAQYWDDDQTLWVCTMDPAAEAELIARARGEITEDPVWPEKLMRSARRQLEKLMAMGHPPVLLCSPASRPLLRALLGRNLAAAIVLSHAEVAPEARIKSVGLVSVEEGPPATPREEPR